MEWECFVSAAQDTYEVCLENLDRFLCNILPVVVWRYKLVLHVVEYDLFFELSGALVV